MKQTPQISAVEAVVMVKGGAMEYSVNAGKIPITALPGSSYFDSADSFAMQNSLHKLFRERSAKDINHKSF